MRDTVVYRTPYTFCHAGAKRQKRNREHWEQVYIYDLLGIYIPFRLIDRYNGLLAHKMFLTTQETTNRVNSHSWGLKAICHDALEPIRAGGRGPRGPRGPGGQGGPRIALPL
jgi:hypothetical protein